MSAEDKRRTPHIERKKMAIIGIGMMLGIFAPMVGVLEYFNLGQKAIVPLFIAFSASNVLGSLENKIVVTRLYDGVNDE